MNKRIIKMTGGYDHIRWRTYRMCREGTLNKKEFLWTKRKKGPDVINYENLMFTDEDLFLNLPMPFKRYRW